MKGREAESAAIRSRDGRENGLNQKKREGRDGSLRAKRYVSRGRILALLGSFLSFCTNYFDSNWMPAGLEFMSAFSREQARFLFILSTTGLNSGGCLSRPWAQSQKTVTQPLLSFSETLTIHAQIINSHFVPYSLRNPCSKWGLPHVYRNAEKIHFMGTYI